MGKEKESSLSFLVTPFVKKVTIRKDAIGLCVGGTIRDFPVPRNRKSKNCNRFTVVYSALSYPYASELAKRLDSFSRKSPIETTEERGGRLIGIRTKENLMTLLKAIALYDGRTTVTKEDFLKLKKLYRFMNYKFKELDVEE